MNLYVNSVVVPFSNTWIAVETLGSSLNSVWYPVAYDDWSQGIISYNYDISRQWSELGLCNWQDENAAQINYICINGTDRITSIVQPESPSDLCHFNLTVDSSVVCAYAHPFTSSTGSPAPRGSCSLVSPSYTAPYNLFATKTFTAYSNNFLGSLYNIRTCGKAHVISLE